MFFKDSAMDFAETTSSSTTRCPKEQMSINNRAQYNVCLTMHKDKKLSKLVDPTSIHGLVAHFDTREVEAPTKNIPHTFGYGIFIVLGYCSSP